MTIIHRPAVFFAGICLFFISSWASAANQVCASVKYSAPSGLGTIVEFVLDKPYDCGQYANGDWWVSAGKDGHVQMLDILPAANDGLNGFEVNPSSKSKQGFDKRVAGYDGALQPRLPLRLRGDASIVKAVSLEVGKPRCQVCLQYSAVLTVLAQPAFDSSLMFRPGYFGQRKLTYPVNAIWKKSLPGFSSACCMAAEEVSFNKIAQRFSGVQLDHLEGWVGRGLHPIDNMADYGASIAVDTSVSLLRFMLNDFDRENATHRSALINYLQMSIDLLSMAENGVTWPADGGHGNGRKLPILVGGYFLDDERFFRVLNKPIFSEDEQVYFSNLTNRALFGRRCIDSWYWMQLREGKGPKDCRDPYGYIDGGDALGEGYQMCCTAMPWKYTALGIRLMGMEHYWNNDAFLEYVGRWMDHGVWADPDPCAPYNGKASDYGVEYGPKKSGGCVVGGGRYLSKHGTNKGKGYYGSKFGDQMWQRYRFQGQIRPKEISP
jgi:hypothetical protein